MKALKNLQQKLEGLLSAVAFAEAGEAETARQLVEEAASHDASPSPTAARPPAGAVRPVGGLPRPEGA